MYANIVPINSSKILLGNEFILDHKSTYNSEMKNLINSIKLISINYMFSTNNTMHKFGIEYSYIATAMGTMLQPTDNNVKSMGINQTNAVAIDWNWGCINSILVLAATILVWVIASMLFAVAIPHRNQNIPIPEIMAAPAPITVIARKIIPKIQSLL